MIASYLDWNTSATSISSSAVPASIMVIVEDSAERVIKELKDGPYTLRLEIKKVPAPTTKDAIKAH